MQKSFEDPSKLKVAAKHAELNYTKDHQLILKVTPPSLERGIESCIDAYRSCTDTLNYCLKEGLEFTDAELQKILKNCAEMCQTSAHFMVSESTFHLETCQLCAVICRECAAECDTASHQDPVLQACRDACLRCAEHCEEMAGSVSGAV